MRRRNPLDQSFISPLNEALNCLIPEPVVDDIIGILSIDLAKMWPSYNSDPFVQYAVKESLHREIAWAIHSYRRSPSDLGTTPSKIKKYMVKSRKTLFEALILLEDWGYETLFEIGTETKEYLAANSVRQKSKLAQPENDGAGPSFTATDLFKKQEYEKNGQWGKYCPFDHDRLQAIEALNQTIAHLDFALEDVIANINGRGIKKKANENTDKFFLLACHIYKKYTGKPPVSWNTGTAALNSHQFTGKIIPFLRAILPYTQYRGEITPDALQAKIARMRKDNPEFKKLSDDRKR